MPVNKGSIYELEVKDIAYGGKGFTKLEGLAVFIDKTIPGDVIKAKIIKKNRNYAEADVIDYLEYSKHRVQPLCSYSGVCGGCKWQFMSYEQQLIYKRKHVSELIRHIALIKDQRIKKTIPSKKIFGYRNKMEFSCSDKKWLLKSELASDVESWFGLGLHVPGTFYKVLDISSCLLQPDDGNKILNDVRIFMKSSNKSPYGLKNHKGFWRFLVIRHSVLHDNYMINIVTAKNDVESVKPLANFLTDKYTKIVSVINSINTKKAGVAVGDYNILLAGQNTIQDKIGQYVFDISINSFFQTNTNGAKKLYDIVKLYAELSGRELVIDLYCGTGTISAYLSDMAKKIVGIDIIESSILDAEKNCNLNNIKNCSFILGDVKNVLRNINIKPDVFIIDPPRAGMHPKVIKEILKILPKKIVYVSCNPATFARDILSIKEFYKIEAIQPIDMFPHTFHIEIVGKLTRI